MSIQEFLFPHEEIQASFDSNELIQYAKTNYQVFFTNQRLILYARTGLILKRDNVISLAYQDIIRLDYQEKGIIKRGYCLVATPLMKYKFEGNPSIIRELMKCLQKYIPTRVAETVKERETIIKEKETVLIQCDYCKGLMPQSSIFCPNCGAKRKG